LAAAAAFPGAATHAIMQLCGSSYHAPPMVPVPLLTDLTAAHVKRIAAEVINDD